MARKFLVPIDLGKNEIQNAVAQNLASAPSSPAKGQFYFNTADNTLYWNAGTPASPIWVAAKDAGATSVFYQTIRDGGTARTQRNALNFVDTAGNTITATDDAAGDETEITVDTVFAAVTAQTGFGMASGNGSSAASARADHTHGTPTHDNTAHATIKLNALAAPDGTVSMGGQIVSNVATPSAGTDAANKNYVDNSIAGLSWKDPVRVATTANITLSGAQTIDGVAVTAGQRVLVKDQSTGSQNGIYDVQSGAWTRSTDADTNTELEGAAVFVMEGTANADKQYTMTTNAPITVGTTALTWAQFGGGTAITAGAGLTGTTTFDVGAGTGITVAADSVALDTTFTDGRYALLAAGAKRFSMDCAAATSTTVTHNLNTRDVIVQVYLNSGTFEQVECDVEHTSTTVVTVRFAVAPTAGQYRIVVLA